MYINNTYFMTYVCILLIIILLDRYLRKIPAGTGNLSAGFSTGTGMTFESAGTCEDRYRYPRVVPVPISGMVDMQNRRQVSLHIGSFLQHKQSLTRLRR